MTKKIELYLAHPFNVRKQVREWELKMEKTYNIKLDNPFYDHDRNDVQSLDKLDTGKGNWENQQKLKKYMAERNTEEKTLEIVQGDLDLIAKNQGIVAYFPEAGTGTPMEIFFNAFVMNCLRDVISEFGYTLSPHELVVQAIKTFHLYRKNPKYGKVNRRPTIVISKIYYNHPWVKQFATHRFKTFKEFEEWLQKGL